MATWLTVMEVVLHASRLLLEPSLLLHNVVADRRKCELRGGPQPQGLEFFHAFCLSQYGARAVAALDGSGQRDLPYVFYEHLDMFLGQGTSALSAFSCMMLKSLPGGVSEVEKVLKNLPGQSTSPAIYHVLASDREPVSQQLVGHLGLVVGPLPLLFHLVLEATCLVDVVEVEHALVVARFDETLSSRPTNVTYTLAAAVCHKAGRYKAVVVDAEGSHWDYDCMEDGRLVRRTNANRIPAASGYVFKCLIYHLSHETPIIDVLPREPKLPCTTKEHTGPTKKIPGKCKVKSSARVFGPEGERHERVRAAFKNGRTAERPRGLKGETARTLDFPGSARGNLAVAEARVTAPTTKPPRKRRQGGKDSLACAPTTSVDKMRAENGTIAPALSHGIPSGKKSGSGQPEGSNRASQVPVKRKYSGDNSSFTPGRLVRRHALKAGTLTPQQRRDNMAFLRSCTGTKGYRCVVSPADAADAADVREKAHYLAAQVLYFSDQTAYGVHQPGPPGKPSMCYFKFDGHDPGGRNTAPISPTVHNPACQVAHDTILRHAMRGELQRHLETGKAYISHTGFLLENITTKSPRDKCQRDPEGYQRQRLYRDGSLSKERCETDADRLYEDSRGAPNYTWRSSSLLKQRNGAVGACHVDSWNSVDEADVVVIVTLTEHGGVYTCCLPYMALSLMHHFFCHVLSLLTAFTDFVHLRDWEHGNEGTSVWTEVMEREDMVVGGPALRLDATIFSNMRPHRAAAPPVGVPVVKLFAVVRLVGVLHAPNDDLARFGSLQCQDGSPRPTSPTTDGASSPLSSPKKTRRTSVSIVGTDGAGSTGGQGETSELPKERDTAEEDDCFWDRLTYVRGQENDERERVQRMGQIPAFDADVLEVAGQYRKMHVFARMHLDKWAREDAAEKADDIASGFVYPTFETEVVCVSSEEGDDGPGKASSLRSDDTDASEEVGSSGDDEGTNPKDDHWLVPRPDTIIKALESMCEDGDGVTKEVCQVLDHLDGGDLAALCHDSVRGGWNPNAGVVDRIKTVLKAALPKMAVNAMDLVKTGTMELLMTGPNTAKTAGGWDEDKAHSETGPQVDPGKQADDADVVCVSSQGTAMSPYQDPFPMSQGSESALVSMTLPGCDPIAHKGQTASSAPPAIDRKTVDKMKTRSNPSRSVATDGKGSPVLNPRRLDVSQPSTDTSGVGRSL